MTPAWAGEGGGGAEGVRRLSHFNCKCHTILSLNIILFIKIYQQAITEWFVEHQNKYISVKQS